MSECPLCGFPVGSNACNAAHFRVCVEPGCNKAPMQGGTTCAKHAGRRLPPVDKKRKDFIRGYYCAVSVLLREQGVVGTSTRSLFNQGASIEAVLAYADEYDLALFRTYKLIP